MVDNYKFLPSKMQVCIGEFKDHNQEIFDA
jgi:hypothetical protein